MNSVDHIAIVVDNPKEAVKYYCQKYGALVLYSDDTWGMIQFENIKLAFVIEGQHPPHIAFEDKKLKNGKLHRDGSRSIYEKDPWNNFIEIIKYKEEE